MNTPTYDDSNADFELAERVRATQQRSAAGLAPQYDFVVCGAGSSGSVVARRLAENPDVSVLLLEARGSDDVPVITEANQWPSNLGSDRDWRFQAAPDPSLNGRSIPFSMGKVLGGGSSINLMIWARGHRNDWDLFASESGEAAWGYESVLDLYRALEDWHGAGEATYRGTGGPLFVQPSPDPHPLATATGDSDRMILPRYTHLLGGLLPEATVKIYPDAGHGFLFQHHAQFAADTARFLDQ